MAEVCRQIGINRQQFNKYLSGQSCPSNRNLGRICAFFGVTPADMELPPQEFAAFRRTADDNPLLTVSKFGMRADIAPADLEELERYCGVYRTYSKVPYMERDVLIGTCFIKRIGDRFVSKYIELTAGAQALNRSIHTIKMYGAVSLEGGFLHILDRYTMQGANSSSGYSHTILHHSLRNPIHLVVGMTLSLAGNVGATPYAAKIVYEKQTDDIGVRDIIRASGRFDADSPVIPDDIRPLIDNKMADGQPVLTHQPV